MVVRFFVNEYEQVIAKAINFLPSEAERARRLRLSYASSLYVDVESRQVYARCRVAGGEIEGFRKAVGKLLLNVSANHLPITYTE